MPCGSSSRATACLPNCLADHPTDRDADCQRYPAFERTEPVAPATYRDLFDHLKILRRGLAAERGVPAYIIFGDASLRDMAHLRPTTRDDFLEVHGVGQKKARDYAKVFLDAIIAHPRATP